MQYVFIVLLLLILLCCIDALFYFSVCVHVFFFSICVFTYSYIFLPFPSHFFQKHFFLSELRACDRCQVCHSCTGD